jgi:hypothetical protein
MKKYLKELDFWEIFPQFYHSNKNKSLKSSFNGLIFFLFFIFAVVFFIAEGSSFFSNLDLVISSRMEENKIKETNITALDIIFGVGFYFKSNGSLIDLSVIDEFFNLDFTLSYNGNMSDNNIQYQRCDSSDFFEDYEWNLMPESKKKELVGWLGYYNCPIKKQNVFLQIKNFSQINSYFFISLSIDENNFKKAIDFIRMNEIYFSFGYSSYFINIKDRYKPYVSEIYEDDFLIDPFLLKRINYEIIPYRIYDDNSLLPSIEYNLYKDEKIEGGDKGLYFSYEQISSDFSFFPNRTKNDNQLMNVYITLSDTSKSIYRDYPKFTSFLAGTNSIIGSLFALVSFIASLVNSNLMTISMTKKRMYSRDISGFSKEYLKDESQINNNISSINKMKTERDCIEIVEKRELECISQITSNNKASIIY